jgi:hypothetical protein
VIVPDSDHSRDRQGDPRFDRQRALGSVPDDGGLCPHTCRSREAFTAANGESAGLRPTPGVVHTAALAPLPPLSDTLALGAAGPTESGGIARWKFHYGWLRGCGSAAFVVGLVVSGQAIGHFGIVVIVWLNAALLLAASPVALGVPQLLASGGHSRATASQASGS